MMGKVIVLVMAFFACLLTQKKSKGNTTTPLQQRDPQIKKVSFCGSLPDGPRSSSILSGNSSPGDMDAEDFETNVDFDDLVRVATGAGSPESANKIELGESQEAMHSTIDEASNIDFPRKNVFNPVGKNAFEIDDEGIKSQKFEYTEKKNLQESSNSTFERTKMPKNKKLNSKIQH